MGLRRANAARGFWACGCAAAIVVAILLLRDPRATSSDSGWFAGAMAVAVLSGVRAVVGRPAARALDAAAVGGMTAVAIATYQIGGLAFLLAGFFFVVAALTEGQGRDAGSSSRRIAGAVGATALVLLLLSTFSPGGAIFIVAPAAIPLIVWAVFVLRRRFLADQARPSA